MLNEENWQPMLDKNKAAIKTNETFTAFTFLNNYSLNKYFLSTYSIENHLSRTK